MASANSSSGYSEATFSAQGDARDAAMSQLLDTGAVPGSSYELGQLGSGSFGVGNVDSTLFEQFSPSASSTSVTAAPQMSPDQLRASEISYENSTEVQAGGRSLWTIAQSLARDGASNSQINAIKNGLIAANPGLLNPNVVPNGYWVNTSTAGVVLDAGDTARVLGADSSYQAARADRAWSAFASANEASVAGLTDGNSPATFRTASPEYKALQAAGIGYGGSTLVSMIPTDGYPTAQPATSEPEGLFAKAANMLDRFQQTDLGRAIQGLPPEGFIVGGVKTGLNALGKAEAVVSELGAAERAVANTAAKAMPAGRLDYSRGLANDLLNNFNPGYTRFAGVLDEDLTLVQFHRSDRALGEGRSAMWWTTPDAANSMSTIGEVRSSLALPPGWGTRDAVSVARIPRGTEVEYYLGTAAPQVDQGVRYAGNGLQMRFKTFDPSWIVQSRKIPGQP